MRKEEFYNYRIGGDILLKFNKLVYNSIYNHLSVELVFSIPYNVFGPGLAIVHRGTIVVAGEAKVGANCRIHEGVTIGATNGSSHSATIGNNVFIATGAEIIGEVTISDNVAIAANAVVIKDVICEDGCTVGGIPAKVISTNNARLNLKLATEIIDRTIQEQ